MASKSGAVWAVDIGNNSLKALHLSAAGDVVEVIALSTVTWEFWGFYFLCEACIKKERKKKLQISVVKSEEDRKQILRANPMYRDRS